MVGINGSNERMTFFMMMLIMVMMDDGIVDGDRFDDSDHNQLYDSDCALSLI